MMWVILLVVIGAVLLFLETLVPGGVLGFLGAVAIAGAVVVAYMTLDTATAHGVLIGLTISSFLGILLWMRFFPTSRLGRRFTIQTSVGHQGFTYDDLLNQRGQAMTPLRPAGSVRIADKRYDVISTGDFVAVGDAVLVTEVRGNRIVVRRA